MLALLLIEEDAVADTAIRILRSEDICTIRFRDPLRLLDAIPDLRPDIIMIRHRDFPLHTQMVVGFVRFYQALSRCKVLVISSSADVLKQTTNIAEDQFLRDPSTLSAAALGALGSSAHRGSRLVERAQRILKE